MKDKQKIKYKKMKKLISITFIIGTLFSIASCSKDIDKYNENPNAPEFVLPNTIFNTATKRYTDVMRNDFQSGRLTLDWMQYWGQNAYADEDRYLYRETSSQAIYLNSYLVANDLRDIIEVNTNPETRELAAGVGNNDNQIAAARIMLAYIFHVLTDTFGDVPYYSFGTDNPDFQALQLEEYKTPVFADQEVIYEDILKELRAAADMINTSEVVFTTGDNIYQGDASKWKKFANSLILRVANRIKGVNPSLANSAITAAIADGVMTSNADNAVQPYEPVDAKASPMWVAFITRTDFAVTAPFVNLLKGTTGNFGPDPRLFHMAAPNEVTIEQIKADDYDTSTDYDDYVGIPYAYESANDLPFTSYSFPSSTILRPDYGEVFMEYAEVEFILSEHNGWDQTHYENGVAASMEKWLVPAADIATFVAALPPATEETVLTQKYVGLYMQSHEAWAEYRRTGYPDTDILLLPGETYALPPVQASEVDLDTYTFTSAVEGLNDLPNRLRYPVTLQTLNGENVQAAISELDNGDTVFSKLFWDVN